MPLIILTGMAGLGLYGVSVLVLVALNWAADNEGRP
jgi:hypothetical protein